MSKISLAAHTFHPSGIIPSSESTNFPSLNGSKSTNQDLNNACACCSKLSFIRWLRAILSSSGTNNDNIRFCFSIDGMTTSMDSITGTVKLGTAEPTFNPAKSYLHNVEYRKRGNTNSWSIIDQNIVSTVLKGLSTNIILFRLPFLGIKIEESS